MFSDTSLVPVPHVESPNPSTQTTTASENSAPPSEDLDTIDVSEKCGETMILNVFTLYRYESLILNSFTEMEL